MEPVDPEKTEVAEPPGKRLVRNTLFMFGQHLLVTVATVFVSAVIARKLGKTDFGTFSYAFVFANLFFTVSSFGLRSVTVRTVAQKPPKLEKYVGLIFALRTLLGIVATALLIAVSRLLHRDPLVFGTVAIAACTVALNCISSTIRDVFQGFENLKVEAVSAVAARAFTFGGALLALLLGGGLLSVTAVYAAGSLVQTAVPYAFLRRAGIRIVPWISVSAARAELRKGLPFATNSILAIFMARINTVFLGNLASHAAAGVYSAALGIIAAVMVIPDAVATSLFPTVARGFHDPSVKVTPILERVFFYMALIGLPLGLGGYLVAGPLIGAIYGPKFPEAAQVFRIVALTLPIEFVTLPANYVLGAIHRQRTVVVITAFTAALNVILSFLLIPRMGALGSAVSAFVCSLTSGVAYQVALARHYRVFGDRQRYVRLLLANLIMVVALLPLRRYHPLLSIPLGVGVYAAAILGLRVMTRTQASDFLRQALGGRAGR